ncbi:bifunctional [glutamate--ammonia ligase]-adenylyl-L-tyrosine phosphorylase/[glutamate--ammonia-ligase] adenylyltransferase [Wenzhouxiangella sp. AB-CW3]|uniref:bifunctional [glutamate--ammonia ligase]-adenylyl-L-tyrosine phosphorylase/[glutamate--ammonia-ligase] adenylyltransferase n=1 Tax=Wenzhouxiangella sp. AB-CW3 TaxID=2771012 RepID=UPI00168B5C6D|nr:bifunctional [glutamate--ammonia ligase]-adenylyl-L-tyrosine phosphorylase/[glutamate--ammonia-ligase] adenylyltransferase [Wenzhouxiangella sp. AB-CW3]QOC22950.1 bifunctional [glutamate--ammonia ligase]-adenylyl-L-tyrosine phosphorylase/[glutamate--ammonia-ligase] adenylyltransferase [Wenzhouxiangella sp. AB-CW3]
MKRPVEQLDLDELSRLCRFVAEARRRFPDAPHPEQPVAPPGADELDKDPAAALRRYRQLQACHILWRDLHGHDDIATTGKAVSALATDCLNLATAAAEARVRERFGRLTNEDGQSLRLAIIGLGKLGGDELNFNSDIDLVFARDGSGRSDGRRPLDASDWMRRVARELIALLDPVTAQGRVWVVDTRLRPFGEAGALVWSLSAMEQYFLSEGRTWERYAWLKAAPVAGDLETGGELIDALQPFIYRRYLDYGIFESLRELHRRIDANSRDREDDIKRGPGGIREMEFLVQSLQILRGGREPRLRCTGFLPALAASTELGLIDSESGQRIQTAYEFLRILENRLQAMTGRQGHRLPSGSDEREKLAQLMGCASWTELVEEMDDHRQAVRTLFAERFREPESVPGAARELWPVADGLDARLKQLGFEQPEQASADLEQLHDALRRRPISAEGRQRLDRLMPALLEEVSKHRPPDLALDDLLRLIEQIARRSAYLSLLRERPQTLSRLVRVFRASDRVAEWIIDSPQLIDDLLDPVHGLDLPAAPEPQKGDQEASLWALGRWRQAAFLKTALAEIDERLDVVDVGWRLSEVAAMILHKVLDLIDPDHAPAVIGYGNLGARQLHYGSDLDLVFLHREGSVPVRTVQRLISAMQMPLPGGRLFEIDTRLRPNGRAGMLVSTLDSFSEYQVNKAWTWEHQALIRARWIAGDAGLEADFENVRRQVLIQPREPETVSRELADMRQRQQRHRRESTTRKLLTDLQFIAELGVLLKAADHPDLTDARTTPEQLDLLAQAGWITPDSARELARDWMALMRMRHRNWLLREASMSDMNAMEDRVRKAWEQAFGQPGPA